MRDQTRLAVAAFIAAALTAGCTGGAVRAGGTDDGGTATEVGVAVTTTPSTSPSPTETGPTVAVDRHVLVPEAVTRPGLSVGALWSHDGDVAVAAGSWYGPDGYEPHLWQLGPDGAVRDDAALPVPEGHTAQTGSVLDGRFLSGSLYGPDGRSSIVWDVSDPADPDAVVTVDDGVVHTMGMVERALVLGGLDRDTRRPALWQVLGGALTRIDVDGEIDRNVTAIGTSGQDVWVFLGDVNDREPPVLLAGPSLEELAPTDLPGALSEASQVLAMRQTSAGLFLGGQVDEMPALWRQSGGQVSDVTDAFRGAAPELAGSIWQIDVVGNALLVDGPLDWWAPLDSDGEATPSGWFGSGDSTLLARHGISLRILGGRRLFVDDELADRFPGELGGQLAAFGARGAAVLRDDDRWSVVLGDGAVSDSLDLEQVAHSDTVVLDDGTVLVVGWVPGTDDQFDEEPRVARVAPDGTVELVTLPWDGPDGVAPGGFMHLDDQLVAFGSGIDNSAGRTGLVAVSSDGGVSWDPRDDVDGWGLAAHCGHGVLQVRSQDGDSSLATVASDASVEVAELDGTRVRTCHASPDGQVHAAFGRSTFIVDGEERTDGPDLPDDLSDVVAVGMHQADGVMLATALVWRFAGNEVVVLMRELDTDDWQVRDGFTVSPTSNRSASCVTTAEGYDCVGVDGPDVIRTTVTIK